MKGNQICLTGCHKVLEGIVYGTPKPGTVMQIKAATEPQNGRLTWEPYAPGTDGEQRLLAVLVEDHLQGKTHADAYVSGTRCFMVVPAAGDELNVLVSAAGTGTGDALAIGAILTVNSGDGLCIATTGTPEMEPFQVMETVSDVVAAGTLVHVIATGR